MAGDKGVVEVAAGEAALCANGSPRRSLPKDQPVSIFQEFVRHIEAGTPMRMSVEEAFALSELCLRAREAADKRAPIRVSQQEETL